jgi:4'-phosphopantetheinyl transferase
MMAKLHAGDVHLWTVERAANGWLDAGDLTGFSDEERQRARQFLDRNARDRFVVGRRLARRVLADYLGTSVTAVAFTMSPRRKPSLSQGGLHFNLSHAGDVVLLGVALCEIGVDIEEVRPERFTDSLIRRVFGAREQALVGATGEPDRMRYQLWVRKEACLKASGIGLIVDLASIDVSAPERVHMPDGQILRAVDLMLRDGYTAAVAGPADAALRPVIVDQR